VVNVKGFYLLRYSLSISPFKQISLVMVAGDFTLDRDYTNYWYIMYIYA